MSKVKKDLMLQITNVISDSYVVYLDKKKAPGSGLPTTGYRYNITLIYAINILFPLARRNR